MQRPVLSVRQLNLFARSLLEGEPRLNDVLVSGELSNFKNHYASGHLYFTLKDKDASIRCVMFRFNAARLKFSPQDGMAVILRGRVSIYEKDGQYQLYAEDMQPDGMGDIALAFEQIKEKLQKEGFFDESTKRPIPKFPDKIAVVTSDTGAAVRDILNIISRRWSMAQTVLCPVAVQGENAVPDMVATLERLYSLNGIDVIIIGRGGGSIEDLWAFNSEELARKIYESPIPVISAVGHETDFTICDFVTDLRAPTPSAAAELAVPDKNEVLNRIAAFEARLKSCLENKYNYLNARLESCMACAVFKNPEDFIIGRRTEYIDRMGDRLFVKSEEALSSAQGRLTAAAGRLEALSPLKVLSRGYTAVSNQKGVVTTVKHLNKGDKINLKFADGTAVCEIADIKSESDNNG